VSLIPLESDERIEFVGGGHADKEPVALARRLAPEVIVIGRNFGMPDSVPACLSVHDQALQRPKQPGRAA
jgi:hypothetical protein